MSANSLQAVLRLADQKRNAQQWREAVLLYRQLEERLGGQAVFHHNLALCLLGAGEADQALVQATRAVELEPRLWQASVVMVKALTMLGRPAQARPQLERLQRQHPERGEFRLELATLALHEDCDAGQARRLVQDLLASPQYGADAQLTDLMASLYDHDESAQQVNDRAMQFAARWLERQPGQALQPPQPRATAGGRPRLGLLSPHFNCSPVYFFCAGALQWLARDFELHFFSRSRREDWATQALRAIASGWWEVTDLDAEALDARLRSHALDALIDLGGWMDPIALRALSTKPAARLAKWVGGQSITTGLRAFDGFITDEAQTPAGFERWYTEPLVRLPMGYVSYTPPPYLPAVVDAPAQEHVLGVGANPVKISARFLAGLNRRLQQWQAVDGPLALRFIDRRYHHEPLKTRIRQALQPSQNALGEQLRIEFIAPDSHAAYLGAIGRLSQMLDTSPYSGGLTTMEALSLGVPCVDMGEVGQLFCERHTHAHNQYLRPAGGAAPALRAGPGAARQSLVPADCPRRNHLALAESLAGWLRGGQPA